MAFAVAACAAMTNVGIDPGNERGKIHGHKSGAAQTAPDAPLPTPLTESRYFQYPSRIV